MHQSTWMAASLKKTRKTPSERARVASPQAVVETRNDWSRRSWQLERCSRLMTTLSRFRSRDSSSFSSRTMATCPSMGTFPMEVRLWSNEWVPLTKGAATRLRSRWWKITITLKRTTTTIIGEEAARSRHNTKYPAAAEKPPTHSNF